MSVAMDFSAIEEIRWHTKTAHVIRKWHRFRGINDFQPTASWNHTVLLPSCERCHIVTFLESRVLRQHHFAHTVSVNWLHITTHSTQRKSHHARASQQACTLCLGLCVSLFLDVFLFLFPVGCGAWQCLCAKQKQRWWLGRGEKKTDSWTYLTRGEGRNVRGIVFLHASAHVWVWRQIKVFHKHIIGTILWELQAQLAGTNLQIWVLHLPHDIVLENHLLVAHLWDLKWAHSQDLEEEEEEEEAHQLKEENSFFLRRKFPVLTSEKILHFWRPARSLWTWAQCSMFSQVGDSFNCTIIPKKDTRVKNSKEYQLNHQLNAAWTNGSRWRIKAALRMTHVREFRNKYVETILTVNPCMSQNFRNILKSGSNLSTLMSRGYVLNGAKNASMYDLHSPSVSSKRKFPNKRGSKFLGSILNLFLLWASTTCLIFFNGHLWCNSQLLDLGV